MDQIKKFIFPNFALKSLILEIRGKILNGSQNSPKIELMLIWNPMYMAKIS
jgi:hypothetical protein